ncbi:DUF2779 domain-containing protein [Polaribacter gangjinensis]|uniref:DUF2779 domain-containing protein n=1 Tax=Polaribacter gangjinensis TaxID=574710 RepID=A0A2S7WBX8_9FLAO|nr:DUF2779 domain-containing protein [Polaribacter gangjinensis]PQJ74761.1 hypothetical protein BTO13_05615 [Polaribacter gangjinensis]
MRVLSKSLFKLGLECPNKLYFTNDKTFANKKSEDTFLQSLAEGGFQVEELARLHYENGVFIDAESFEYNKPVDLTNKALLKDNVIIYEGAFSVNDYYVRCDIIEKKGNKIRLIEVKAKSFNPTDDYLFIGKNGKLVSGWKPYLFDLAFQKKVVQMAFPSYEVEAYLMMADKTKKASIDGLNQLFRVPKNGNPRTEIVKRVTKIEEIGKSVLSEINVDSIINSILENKFSYYENLNFSEAMLLFREAYKQKKYLNWPLKFSNCKACEFKTSEEEKQQGLKSGFEHCFKKQLNWSDADFKRPNAMEIWNYRGGNLIEENRLFLDDLTEDDLKVTPIANKISPSERQWIQVEKARTADASVYVEKEGLKAEMERWIFPLHFIDFETSTVALPFTVDRHPYEQVAFQFSHHVYHEDGTIEHRTEFISNTPGEFPNFIFARALKEALIHDDGSIFRFATHENSILNAIIQQLKNSSEADKEELISFLKTITVSKKDSAESWDGDRKMIDLNVIVKDYYYNPYTKGSNSIKAVLPASLNSSEFLKKKYENCLEKINVSSKNFSGNHIWLSIKNNEIINPYKMLPPLYEGWDIEEIEDTVSEIENIADGGSALTAYAKLQYEDMTEKERGEITAGLLKYCELDTLAMVMIYEHLKELTI